VALTEFYFAKMPYEQNMSLSQELRIKAGSHPNSKVVQPVDNVLEIREITTDTCIRYISAILLQGVG